MCGITGWVNWNKPAPLDSDILQQMTDTLKRRGPDETNYWYAEHTAFGHQRLVVVDPKGGRQPMTREKEGFKYTICYNGELYNTEDIRKELLNRGYTFKSHSDTDVLLAAYVEWRENCVEYLNGIYAFAVWDEQNERLFMARDRLGVKPLFYYLGEGFLLFGSEIKALLAHPLVQPEVDREGLAEVFGLGPSRTPGHGVFCGIKELRPAFACCYGRTGFRQWRYWNVESAPHPQSIEETSEQVQELLRDAVERQLVADVPVCTLLSGGVDSSAITAFACRSFSKEGRPPLHTYSIDYVGNDRYFQADSFQPDEDTPYIDKVSTQYGTVHTRYVINIKDLVTHLGEAVTVKDLPGMADVDSSLLWFCKQIKQSATVALSGECADEIFGGYPWFHRKEIRDSGFPWMSSLEQRIALLNPEWQRKVNLDEYVRFRYDATIRETPYLEGESDEDRRRRELFYLNMIWFMTTLLDRKDRMSMGASLEVRVPFADHRLVEYVWNIPWKMKMADGREKGILRRALSGILPDDVLYRKKSPYPKTHNPGYTEAVKRLLSERLAKPSPPLLELVDEEQVRTLMESSGDSFKVPWFGQLMRGPQLIAHLAQIDTWMAEYGVVVRDR